MATLVSCKGTDNHKSVLFAGCGIGTTLYICGDCGEEFVEYEDTNHGG
jgi:hypothetical protein